MTQPEALRLAQALNNRQECEDEAADELRRLDAECNDLAHQLNQSNERNGRLIAQRDALLEFAKYVEAIDPNNPAPLFEKARAAIKAVEENT